MTASFQCRSASPLGTEMPGTVERGKTAAVHVEKLASAVEFAPLVLEIAETRDATSSILLVDDLAHERWTLTVTAHAIRRAGAVPMLTFVLAPRGEFCGCMLQMGMPLSPNEQARLRLAIFAELEQRTEAQGGFLTGPELLNFEVGGVRIPLIDRARGIRNPIEFDSTLSIVSSADGPYDDAVGADGLLRYDFQARDPLGGDNRKLREAMVTQTPIILFEKPMTGIYVPIIAVHVIDEDRIAGHFVIATDEAVWRSYRSGAENPVEKRYVEQLVRKRVHQPVFRARVILAYSHTCAVCRLKHAELLDAAHIIADSDEAGLATVTNGIALCKIHHAAYDRNLLGVSADYIVHINQALLDEVDGPMLRYGLQDMHGVALTVPSRKSDQPSRDALAARFATFRI